jgi:cytochrome c5
MEGSRSKSVARILWTLSVAILAAHLSQETMSAQVSATAQSNDQAQIQRGRQIVGQVCVACHTNILRMVAIHRQSPDQWRDTVYSMIGRGAEVMPDEIDSVTAFLAANAGSNRQGTAQTPTGVRLAAGRDQLPPSAEGRGILQRSCQQCHDLATASTKLDSEDWDAVITKMMTYGALLTHADQQKLAEYLNSLAR